MRSLTIFIFTLVLAVGCSDTANTDTQPATSPAPASQSSPATERGGTITVADESWTIAKFGQCDSYPGDIVHIWGQSTDDPPVEITIDYGGPNSAKIGEEYPPKWQTEPDTLKVQIDGRRIQGSATFFRHANGQKEFAQGSFEMNC